MPENRQNRPPKALKTAKMGLGRAEKGPVAAFPRPRKDREVSESFPEGLGRHPGWCGRHLKAFRVILGSSGRVPATWAGHLGHLGHVRVSRNRLDLVVVVFGAFCEGNGLFREVVVGKIYFLYNF